MADISEVITVTLLQQGAAILRDNANVCMFLVPDASGPINSANRFRLYRTVEAVETEWGSTHPVTLRARAFFGTTPNPINAGGVLVVGFWRFANENVGATSATLTGDVLDEATVVATLQQISDGIMTITVDGGDVDGDGMNFQAITTLADVIAILESNFAGMSFELTPDKRILGTSDTTGVTSTLSFGVQGPNAGDPIHNLLKLEAGTGAVLVQGAAATVLSAESETDALAILKALVDYKGFVTLGVPVDPLSVGGQAQGNDTLFYESFFEPESLVRDPVNDPWNIKLSGLTNTRMLFRPTADEDAKVSYMARTHTVNFAALNSALTMQLKQLQATPDDLSDTDIALAKLVGLDVYVSIKDKPNLLTSGANAFTDTRYNILAYLNAVQTDAFNVLGTTPTKVPQTEPGVDALVDAAEKTTRGFVKSGVFAPGEWTSPDTFGDRETFLRAIRQNGFYVLAGFLEDQSTPDREARKSPVIQVAVKGAGAIHSADFIINFEL